MFCCRCLKAFPLPPRPPSLFSVRCPFSPSRVIEWINVWRRVFLFREDKTLAQKPYPFSAAAGYLLVSVVAR